MSRGGARLRRAPVTCDEQDRGQNKDRHDRLSMGGSKVHNRFLAISRDGRHGDDEKRLAMMDGVDNLRWVDPALDSRRTATTRIPELNASRLPWLQPALAKGLLARRRNMATEGAEVIGTTGQFRPRRVLAQPTRRFRTPFWAPMSHKTSSSVDNLGSVARRTSPWAQNWRKKVTSGMGLPALRDPGKMLDMVLSSHVLRH